MWVERRSSEKNQKTTEHETKEVVSNPNSKVRIWNFDNFDIMSGKLKKIALVESDIFCWKVMSIKSGKNNIRLKFKPTKSKIDKAFTNKFTLFLLNF